MGQSHTYTNKQTQRHTHTHFDTAEMIHSINYLVELFIFNRITNENAPKMKETLMKLIISILIF